MAPSETLTVLVTERTRRALSEAAITQGVAGASALAREILERWADRALEMQTKATIDRAVSYLKQHPGGWGDDPNDFFPGLEK